MNNSLTLAVNFTYRSSERTGIVSHLSQAEVDELNECNEFIFQKEEDDPTDTFRLEDGIIADREVTLYATDALASILDDHLNFRFIAQKIEDDICYLVHQHSTDEEEHSDLESEETDSEDDDDDEDEDDEEEDLLLSFEEEREPVAPRKNFSFSDLGDLFNTKFLLNEDSENLGRPSLEEKETLLADLSSLLRLFASILVVSTTTSADFLNLLETHRTVSSWTPDQCGEYLAVEERNREPFVYFSCEQHAVMKSTQWNSKLRSSMDAIRIAENAMKLQPEDDFLLRLLARSLTSQLAQLSEVWHIEDETTLVVSDFFRFTSEDNQLSIFRICLENHDWTYLRLVKSNDYRRLSPTEMSPSRLDRMKSDFFDSSESDQNEAESDKENAAARNHVANWNSAPSDLEENRVAPDVANSQAISDLETCSCERNENAKMIFKSSSQKKRNEKKFQKIKKLFSFSRKEDGKSSSSLQN